MKKYLLRALIGVCALALVVSCVSGDEAAGDKAYNMAKKATGGARREQLKTAFMNYRKAVMANPDNISTKLRNRFIEMCITRAQIMLEEGGAFMEGIPLLREDIESHLKDDVDPALRQKYAGLVAQLGDSSAVRDRFIDALRYYDSAIEQATDPTPFRQKRASVISNVANENYEIAKFEFDSGKKENDEEDKTRHFIRAEYFAKVALYFDSTHTQALNLLSDIYKENIYTYVAFRMAVTDYTDTVMFRRINHRDIVLAVEANRGTQYVIRMHSSTYNPLRMRSENFSLIDRNGRVFQGASGMKMQPDILEYEREGTYTINFPGAPAMSQIKKLVYENGPHKTDKYFL